MDLTKEKTEKYLMHTYNSIPMTLISGEGCHVTDSTGKKYLDFLSGIAVNALGYSNDSFNKAISGQLDKIIHFSNLFLNNLQADLAEKLVENSSFDKAFFCNSGTEAVEASLKLAKKFGKKKKNGAWKILAMNKSFHGRTSGSLSLTGQMKYRETFLPLLPGVVFADFNDFEDLKQKADGETCAIILEPVQGEGGIHPADKDYLVKVREFCTRSNIALIFDEVQCGMGRTGTLFAHEQYRVVPDIVCLAKGLGGGLPIGAILATEEFNLFEPGDHAATFGGNPLVCSGALAVLTELIDHDLLSRIKEISSYLFQKLEDLSSSSAKIKEIRGKGLMIGIELDGNASQIAESCREHGLIVGTAGANVLRLVPPLIIGEKEVDEAVDILKKFLK